MPSLTSDFKIALASWRPQTVSFFSLPPEVRNIVYAKLLEPLSIIWLPRAFHHEQNIWPIRSFLQTHPQICQELKTELFSGEFVVRISVGYDRADLTGPSLLLLHRLEPLNIQKLTLFGRLSSGLVMGPTTAVEYEVTVSHDSRPYTIDIVESIVPPYANARSKALFERLKRVAARGLQNDATRGLGCVEVVAFMRVLSQYCARPYFATR